MKRYIEYDLMRIVACLGVIMIHVAVFDQGKLWSHTTFEFQAINFWGVMSRWAVPTFVMLSGMMILPHGDEISISKLLKHRVLRMLGAYIAWSCVYSFYNVYFLDIVYAPTKLKTFIDGCFSGELHMWYLLMLSGLYLASPLLAIVVKKADKKWIVYWLNVLFLFTSIIPFIVKLNIKFISTIVESIYSYMDLQFFGGWTLYFILGFYIQQCDCLSKRKKIIYFSSILSFIFTLYGTIVYSWQHGSSFGVLPYEYPNIVLMSVGVLFFFKEKISKMPFIFRYEKFIVNLSKLTFGIYLIHVLLLKVLYSLGINIQLTHPIISVPVVAILVFVIGAGIVWLLRKVPMVGTYWA